MKRLLETALVLGLLVSASGCCCCAPIGAAREAARRVQSQQQMRIILLGILNYQTTEGKLPDNLDQIMPFVEGDDTVFENPVTNDYPGYEYVKPDAPFEELAASETIVLYQLRDGVRDETLAVGYLDGSVVEPEDF